VYPLLIAGVVLAVLLAVVAALLSAKKKPAAEARYVREPALLTAAERSFFGALDAAIGAEYRVFPKVRVADVIGVEAHERGAWQSAFNRISAKHFDFVICDQRELAPRAVIELNDVSHQRPDRQRRDELLRDICKEIALPLIEFAPRRAYKLDSLRQQVLTAMGVPDAARGRREPYAAVPQSAFEREDEEAATVADVPPATTLPVLAVKITPPPVSVPELLPSTRSEAQLPSPTAVAVEPASVGAPAPRCPKCAGDVQRRRIGTGQLAGREFWLCRTFPTCSGMLPVLSR
jgi:hypothetical protein